MKFSDNAKFDARFVSENREAFRQLREWQRTRPLVYRRNISVRALRRSKPRKMSYVEYMASPQWQARRRAYYRAHSKECFICRSPFRVGLHHRTYDNLGSEKDDDLVPLCWLHHEALHEKRGNGKLDETTDHFISSEQELHEARELAKRI
jgi:5-methylcytosine-specific restriction endonuclease McrA